MTVEERRRRRFSEPFKKEQVQLIEHCELTVRQVSELYEVKAQNVRLWLKKYGSKEQPPRIIVSKADEYDRIGKLEKQNKELKQIIADQQIQIISQCSIIELAEEKLGTGFEKK